MDFLCFGMRSLLFELEVDVFFVKIGFLYGLFYFNIKVIKCKCIKMSKIEGIFVF